MNELFPGDSSHNIDGTFPDGGGTKFIPLQT